MHLILGVVLLLLARISMNMFPELVLVGVFAVLSASFFALLLNAAFGVASIVLGALLHRPKKVDAYAVANPRRILLSQRKYKTACLLIRVGFLLT